ncbi:MAG: hypothetical protein LBQ94_10175 [Treponema sp.]|jgi:hypothetical protein|nr:hypothetical protein [Treponema sp.]
MSYNASCKTNKNILGEFVKPRYVSGEGIGFKLNALRPMRFQPLDFLAVCGKPMKLHAAAIPY